MACAGTLVVRDVSSVHCSKNCVEYTVEGSPASFTWPAGESTDSQSTHRALLVRGRVFQGTEVLHWQTVASELWKVPLDLPQLRRSLRLRGVRHGGGGAYVARPGGGIHLAVSLLAIRTGTTEQPELQPAPGHPLAPGISQVDAPMVC